MAQSDVYVDWEQKSRNGGHIKISMAELWAGDDLFRQRLPHIVDMVKSIVDGYLKDEGISRAEYMKGKPTKVYLDISCNRFADHRIIDKLVKELDAQNCFIYHWRCYQNCYGDTMMRSIAQYIMNHNKPGCAVEEIHMSHNFVNKVGAILILRGLRANKNYPNRDRGTQRYPQFMPLWLRLESNCIDNGPGNRFLKEIQSKIKSDSGTIAVCFADNHGKPGYKAGVDTCMAAKCINPNCSEIKLHYHWRAINDQDPNKTSCTDGKKGKRRFKPKPSEIVIDLPDDYYKTMNQTTLEPGTAAFDNAPIASASIPEQTPQVQQMAAPEDTHRPSPEGWPALGGDVKTPAQTDDEVERQQIAQQRQQAETQLEDTFVERRRQRNRRVDSSDSSTSSDSSGPDSDSGGNPAEPDAEPKLSSSPSPPTRSPPPPVEPYANSQPYTNPSPSPPYSQPYTNPYTNPQGSPAYDQYSGAYDQQVKDAVAYNSGAHIQRSAPAYDPRADARNNTMPQPHANEAQRASFSSSDSFHQPTPVGNSYTAQGHDSRAAPWDPRSAPPGSSPPTHQQHDQSRKMSVVSHDPSSTDDPIDRVLKEISRPAAESAGMTARSKSPIRNDSKRRPVSPPTRQPPPPQYISMEAAHALQRQTRKREFEQAEEQRHRNDPYTPSTPSIQPQRGPHQPSSAQRSSPDINQRITPKAKRNFAKYQDQCKVSNKWMEHFLADVQRAGSGRLEYKLALDKAKPRKPEKYDAIFRILRMNGYDKSKHGSMKKWYENLNTNYQRKIANQFRKNFPRGELFEAMAGTIQLHSYHPRCRFCLKNVADVLSDAQTRIPYCNFCVPLIDNPKLDPRSMIKIERITKPIPAEERGRDVDGFRV